MHERKFPRRQLSAPATIHRGSASSSRCYVVNASAEGLCLALDSGRSCRVGEVLPLTLGTWEVPVVVRWVRRSTERGSVCLAGVELVSENASRACLRAFSEWIFTGFTMMGGPSFQPVAA